MTSTRGRFGSALAQWAPPERLVVVGLYRFSRNPMYVSVLVVLCGWALLYKSPAVWIYAAVIAAAFHLRIVFGEEQWLSRTHGAEWFDYRARVSRWFGWTAPRRQPADLRRTD